MVKCRFKVISKTVFEANSQSFEPTMVKLQPVICEPFGKFTPAGSIELQIQNDDVSKQFEVGKEYLVDFTPIN